MIVYYRIMVYILADSELWHGPRYCILSDDCNDDTMASRHRSTRSW